PCIFGAVGTDDARQQRNRNGDQDVHRSCGRSAFPPPLAPLGAGLPLPRRSTLPLGAIPVPTRATHDRALVQAHGALWPRAAPRGLFLAPRAALAGDSPTPVGDAPQG